MGSYLIKYQEKIFSFIKKKPFLYYWLRLFKNTLGGFSHDGGFHLSAGLAFFALFATFPMLLLGISFLGFHLSHPEAIAGVTDYLNRFLPYQADTIIQNARSIANYRGRIGIAGFVILMWVSRGLFLALEYSVNQLWNLDSRRSYIHRNILAFALILSLTILSGLSLLTTTVIAYLTQLEIPILNISICQLSFYGQVNRFILSTMFVFLVFTILFKLLPHCRVTIKEIIPGALFTTILWKLAEMGYLWYMSNMARMQEIYGSLGGLFGVIFWFYIGAIVFSIGAKFCVVRLRLLGKPPVSI